MKLKLCYTCFLQFPDFREIPAVKAIYIEEDITPEMGETVFHHLFLYIIFIYKIAMKHTKL